ncbi:MAG: roadblock/LC7 domain-containing protein [Gammaproteobacteria bacterium]
MYTTLLNSILNDLNASASGIGAAEVISSDGMPLASALPGHLNEDGVGAMSAALLSLGHKAAKELNWEDIEQVVIKGRQGYAVMTLAGKETILTVMAKPEADLGLIFSDVGRAVENISATL